MSQFRLDSSQRSGLRRELKAASDARFYRRLLALLELDRGRSAAEVAQMLGVTRQSVYNWKSAYMSDPDPSALIDEDRSGRPPIVGDEVGHLLRGFLARSPQDYGRPHTSWTIPLLQGALERWTGSWYSDDTIRRCLRDLGYEWKRPRYVLAPDPEREKKTPDLPPDPGPAAAQRGARPGRDRSAALPAVAGRMVAEGPSGQGLFEWPQRPPGDLRGAEPDDRHEAVAAATQGTQW
jgi:transposase